ncbi:PLP-dependent aminotransferase family protein [Deinococcus hopiensis]|uniref:DNA-binding transcriptional regulator, MocR family, contains an aminotransferase domain n=1 Tax=Deinococcus hopiensis KR-140 TaxID=695939 RepID=A0A1W1VWB4_9DEIO|nr:PLP-dependent aminotransferase family protein [Deinococcus hopiensis]SMB97401.1 DNA-binding transcriptional regulator, MocR family, contains an aminotransferase domain [Deinococcus hopiensis KR-140]
MSSGREAVTGRQGLLLDLKALIQHESKPGDRLPSVRELTRRYGTSPVTVSAVVAQLVREGLVTTRPGHGTFVAAPSATPQQLDLGWQTVTLAGRAALPGHVQDLFRPPLPDVLPLGNGYPDETLQPLELLGSALRDAAKRPGVWSRLPAEGLDALRAWFARELGGEYRASDVLIVPGAQAGLSTSLRALLPAGAPLLVESPTYYGVLAAAQAVGARPVPVPADAEGIRPDLLDMAFRSSGARVLYLQPRYASPTGASLALGRRAAVLAAAERAGAFIIEDDYARDLTLHGEPLPPLALAGEGRVVYLRSLTKAVAPGMRIAALIARGPVWTRLRNARATEDYFLAGPLQEAALGVLTARSWPRHLGSLRETLRVRRDTMVQALTQHWPQARLFLVPQGGYNLWVQLPGGLGDLEFAEQAARAGVQVSAGSGFFPTEPGEAFVRLSYAAASPSVIEEAVHRLKPLVQVERAGSRQLGKRQNSREA